MNERIKLLAEQAELSANQGDHVDVKMMMEKFAELIVKECVETLGSYEDYWNHYEQMEMLKKHFGVEL